MAGSAAQGSSRPVHGAPLPRNCLQVLPYALRTCLCHAKRAGHLKQVFDSHRKMNTAVESAIHLSAYRIQPRYHTYPEMSLINSSRCLTSGSFPSTGSKEQKVSPSGRSPVFLGASSWGCLILPAPRSPPQGLNSWGCHHSQLSSSFPSLSLFTEQEQQQIQTLDINLQF